MKIKKSHLKELIRQSIAELKFKDKAAFDKYNKKHKMKPTTKVDIGGKETTAAKASGKKKPSLGTSIANKFQKQVDKYNKRAKQGKSELPFKPDPPKDEPEMDAGGPSYANVPKGAKTSAQAKGMKKGRVGMLLYYGKKPIISWLLLNFIRARLLNSNIEKSFERWKKKIPLPESDLKLFTLTRGIKLIKNFKEAVRYGTTGVHRDANLYSKDWGFNLQKIKKKIFIWHGDDDLTVPIVTSEHLKRELKNNELFVKPKEGHFSICYNFMNDIVKQVSE